MHGILDKIKDFYSQHKKPVLIIGGIIAGILIFRWVNITFFQQPAQKDPAFEPLTSEELAKLEDEEEFKGTDTYLWDQQKKLTKKNGEAPEGFLWDTDNTLLALGDKSMSGEDVIYIYLQSLSKLDLSNAQKYSRKASCVKRYMNYYDNKMTTKDYAEQFKRNIYAEALKSLQVKKVENTASLAQNKQVYTVEASIIDLTNKDFWKNDKKTIYNALQKYGKDQGDETKSEVYLYDYIYTYFQKPTAIRRNITFDITVEKFADIDTGWLVTIDTDLDNACIYKDGKTIVSYIKESFRAYRQEQRMKKNTK